MIKKALTAFLVLPSILSAATQVNSDAALKMLREQAN